MEQANTPLYPQGHEGHKQFVANNCRVIPTEKPLTPIRDAASGLVFIPPARWTAKNVQLAIQSGSDIPVYGNSAALQFEYRFRDIAKNRQFPLLDILVFPKAEWDKHVDANSTPEGLWLGEDTHRVYLAQLPAEDPSDLTNEGAKAFMDLQISEEEVKQAFSMYGVVANNRVETVTAKVMWLDRALYPGAILIVELRDVSRMDAPAELIAKQQITLENGAPQSIILKFAPEAINPQYTYSVSARLEQDGKLIKINDTHTPVLTRGAPRETEVIFLNP